MRIVILGPPGAGKGTQALLLAKNAGIPHVSTGEILRAAIAANSPLGQKAQSFVDIGKLVPDDLMIDLVKERLSQPDCEKGFLLDGFPRTVPQAEALTIMLKEIGKSVTHVLDLEVDENIILDRISKRGQESGRSDDNLEVAKKRLDVYRTQTAPVTDYYKTQGHVYLVDGLGTVEAVQASILAALK